MSTSREGIRTTKPLRVQVLSAQAPREYTNAANKKMVVVEAVVADRSGFMKLSLYNRLSFPFIKSGNSLMLLNVIGKPKEIVATSESKIIMIPEVTIPEDIRSASIEANLITGRNEASDIKISNLNQEKEGTIFNVTCKVVECNAKMTVNTQWNKAVDVRNGKVADETGDIDFAFWRNLADFPLTEGVVVKISNGQLSKTSTNLPKVTNGRYTTIEILPSDLIQVTEDLSLSANNMEEAEIVGISSLNMYKSCKTKTCYSKKLVNNICPTCLKEDSGDSTTSVVCSVMICQDDAYRELTFFTPEVEELLQKPITPTKEEVEGDLLNILPLQINYIESPKKDNTVSKVKRKLRF